MIYDQTQLNMSLYTFTYWLAEKWTLFDCILVIEMITL